ncbi:MAG: hypothetical protein K2P55_12750 [Bacteroides acidifaciens]|uniref:hypothetical protein n=1 Tax=Bacteroides acidifaciens TaxID=85831 RepID=UPI0023CE6574|nr:hypothetical protein [Bacteroides acidifaciens]MDE6822559.1 hypothetical protein [Bacteroides acidifaciens]MDE6987753.1 hypothetical protein [Bacteroides acidifaciens]
MEDSRERLVIILAGYTQELKLSTYILFSNAQTAYFSKPPEQQEKTESAPNFLY